MNKSEGKEKRIYTYDPKIVELVPVAGRYPGLLNLKIAAKEKELETMRKLRNRTAVGGRAG